MSRPGPGGKVLVGSPNELGDSTNLERRSWRNWFLFLAVAILTTVGLAIAILRLVGDRISDIWPWANTDLVLMAGLSLAILLFSTYLTLQQRRVVVLRRQLLKTNQDAALRSRRAYDRLVALLNVSRVLSIETNPQTVFESITQTCLRTFDCQQAALMLLNEEGSELKVCSVSGRDATAKELASDQRVGCGLVGWVAGERQPLMLGPGLDPAAYPGLKLEGQRPAAAMVAPIITRGDLVGVLSVSSSSPGVAYDDEDMQALLLFAESVGICCRHAEQTDWMRQTIHRLDAALRERGTDEDQRVA